MEREEGGGWSSHLGYWPNNFFFILANKGLIAVTDSKGTPLGCGIMWPRGQF